MTLIPAPPLKLQLIMDTIRVKREELEQIIRQLAKGNFFRVKTIKRTTGEERIFNARLGVKKYLAGGELKYNPREKQLLIVYDMVKHGYRAINLADLIDAQVGGKIVIPI